MVKLNPLFVAVSGSFGGFTAWLISHGQTISLLFQVVGGFFGCLLAIVSFIFVLPKLVRFVKGIFKRGFEQADRE
jgi:hypothetical protein